MLLATVFTTATTATISTTYECPITGKSIEDSVIDPEGNTYEKSAILQWIEYNGTSPITESPIRSQQLIPNHALFY